MIKKSTLFSSLGLLLVGLSISNAALASGADYYPITPCRAVNTRNTIPSAPLKALESARIFKAYGDDLSDQGGRAAGCAHPKAIDNKLPVAIAANIVAIGAGATGNGNLIAFPGDVLVTPETSIINYKVGTNISNSTIISLARQSNANNFKVQSNLSDVDIVIDILGYFYENGLSHVITVSSDEGNFNGDNDSFGGGDYHDLAAAIASIPATSNTDRYLVTVGPGLYKLDASLQVPEYVDIRGAGENMTHLMRIGGGVEDNSEASVISAASHSTLSYLTVISDGDNDNVAIGIYNGDNSAMKVSHVTVNATGARINNYAVYVHQNAAPMVDNATLISDGLKACGLFATDSASPSVLNSTLTGTGDSSWGLRLTEQTQGAQIINSRIVGGMNDGVVEVQCRGNYNENLQDIDC